VGGFYKAAGNKISKSIIAGLVLLLLFSIEVAADSGGAVYVIPVEGIIDGGLAAYVERAYMEAGGADRVILEIDTPGGLVKAAEDIRAAIKGSSIPTTAFIKGGAISAGVLIALSAENIYMAPGTTIGAAEPRAGGSRADEKFVSYWSSLLATAAEERGRDGQIARAMADRDVVIPGLKEKGKLLTLTDKEALELGFAEGKVSNMEELLDEVGEKDAVIKTVPMNTSEKLTRIVTNPYVAPLLLAIGFIGLAVELLTVGFGVAGLVSLIAFVLYFWGHMFAGFSGWGVILLFIGGIALILVEVAVIPGFGAAGIGGMVALLTSVVLAAGSVQQGIISLIFALVGTSLAVYFSLKYGRTRQIWQRLILSVKLDTESGYVAPESSLKDFVGKRGITLTPLRPAGAAQIEGHRLDVVSEGSFVPKGSPVQVIRVEGVRIVVREIKN